MTKRREIMQTIAAHARANDLHMRLVEGGSHTRVWLGDRYTTVPRHREIPDRLAQQILRQIGIEE
ncbi:type II toxin-antitoxin system HicA family toxin [Gordonia sp. (in: high G+C Gram-positive bacteria)]|uniref:type II toxin-antitoxin system HicA family toxin n=1 Tax=Gordonia sp. (in: high G+C Gram-positive bacteria) TaxID=84139 RepID=UPI0035271D3E